MASSSNRDVRMTLAVDTIGEEGITDLQQRIQKLAKEGGAAAPEFQKLADEIGRIGEQAAALRAVEKLTEETAQLAQRQELAAAAALDLRTKLDALKATTTATAESQRAAAAALEAARQKQFEISQSLKLLSAETDRAGKSDAAYTERKRALTIEAIKQATEVRNLKTALSSANSELSTATTAESALAEAHRKAAAAAAAAAAAYQANQAALRTATQAANELGVVTDNTAAAQAEIVAALNATGAAANRLQSDLNRLEQQERDLLALRAFEQMANDAAALRRAAEYAQFWERELQKIEQQEKDLLKLQMDAKWQREAEALVNAAHAAQKLAREAQILEAAERELAAQRAFEKQAQDAANLIRAGDYIRNFREQLEKAEQQARETAEAAAAASKKISSAFSTLGVKSAQDLEAEIARVRAAMRTVENQAGLTGGQLRTAFEAGNQRIAELQRQLRAVNGELSTSDRLAGLFSQSIAQISAGNIIANGFGFLIQKVKDLAVAFVNTIVQTQNLKRALTAVYGDAAIVSKQFEFLKSAANTAGISIGGIQQAFVKFSAATKASGIGLETTNALFLAVTRSAGILGLTGEQVTGTLEALSQMASKGTVSMEELRQQLGDRLPGALSLVASGLGLTEAQLVKLVESGGLAARDLFPALTTSLGKMSGEANGLSNTFQRFKNMLTETAQSTGDAVWTQVLTRGLQAMGLAAAAILVPFNAISTLLGTIGRGVGILAASLVTLTNPMQALSEMVGEQRKRYDALNLVIGNTITGNTAAATAVEEHRAKMVEAGEAAAEEASQVVTTSKALQAQALAEKLAADKTLDRSSALVQLKAAIDAMLSAQEAQIDADQKLAKAAKIQGDALVDLAKLRGKDYETMQVQIKASNDYAVALDKAAESQKTETELLIIKRDEIIKTAMAQEGNTRARRVEIENIEKQIIASKAETEQSIQAAAAARQEAADRALASKTYEDNSARVDEFRKAMEAAQQAVVAMTIAERDGYGTKEQVVAATRREAEATALYNDAIKDSIAALELQQRVQQAGLNLKLTAIDLEVKNLENMAASRKAAGDFAGALFYEIEARRKQIEAIKLTSEAKRLEAEATIKALEIERAALDQKDPMLKAKQAEIDIRLANAKAKLLEADAGKIAIDALEREIRMLRENFDARDKSKAAVNGDTKARQENAKAIDAQTAALKRKQGATYDEEGYALNTEGQRISAAGKDRSPTKNQDTGEWNYIDKNGQWRTAKSMPVKDPAGGYMEPGGRRGAVTGSESAESYNPNSILGAAPNSPAQAAAASANQYNPQVQTININIGGRATEVNVASAEDAHALTSVLRQLETAAGTA